MKHERKGKRMMVDFKKLTAIMDHYGKDEQTLKAIEELNELAVALTQSLTKGKESGIISEVADVYIMLEQIVCYHEIDPQDLKDTIEFKLDRQIGRIEKKGA